MYNSEKYISETIDSVLAQSYQYWEMIIINDLSSDNSTDIVKKYLQKDNRLKLIELEEKGGPAKARNEGIKLAQGKYLTFIDSDDLWHSSFLEKQVSFLENNNIPLSYASYQRIDTMGNPLKKIIVPKVETYKRLLKSNYISCLTAMYNVEILGKQTFINVGHEDYVYWLSLLKKIKYAKGIQEVLAYYRVGKKSVSSNKFQNVKWQWNIYRNIENINFFHSIYYMFFYTIHGIFKNWKL